MHFLVTGGAGYIGSHTVVAILQAGHRVTILDNFTNSDPTTIARITAITGERVEVVRADLRDRTALARCLQARRFDAVLHFAGLKAVAESTRAPLAYYNNNVLGTLQLCQAMQAAGVFRLIFSSSATVYGDPAEVPVREDAPTGAVTNPYGRSKHMVEHMLFDLAQSDPRWAIGILRYFNPAGAHESGQIGEDPGGEPANLLPYVSQVAAGLRPALSIFGADYPTADGTGVRDYIHVMDLAEGHLRALEATARRPGVGIWNLGRGEGYSVLEIVTAFEQASGRQVPCRIVNRRPGDIAACWADPTRDERELGWRARRDLSAMMRDTWRWQSGSAATPAAITRG